MTATTSATFLDTLTVGRQSAASTRAIRVLSVLFIAVLTAAAAQISAPVPFTNVPFTFQPMVVLLGGLALGSRLGSASQLVYLAAGIIGLPVFAASGVLPPGALRLIGPTGGYLMAYPFAAFVVGYLAERDFDRHYVTSVVAMAIGLVVVYGFGVVWLAFFARTATQAASVGLDAALLTGLYPFVIPDLIKLLAAASILPGLWRLTGHQRNLT